MASIRMQGENDFDYETEDWGNALESELKYQARDCVFCHQRMGRNEHIRFNFSPGQKYMVAHYECFQEKLNSLGMTEDAITEFLDYLDIEVEI